MKKIFMMLIAMLHFSQLAAQIVWGAPVNLSTVLVNASDPQIVIDTNGNKTAAWVESGVIKANTLPFNGTWGVIVPISGVGSSSPRLGVDGNGNVTAVWVESGLVETSTLPFNGSWSLPTVLSGTGASTPSLAVDNAGDIAVVWARSGFIEAQTKPSGGSFNLNSSVISSPNSDNPHVAMGPNGNIMATWHSTVSGSNQVHSSNTIIGGSWSASKSLVTGAAFSHNYPKVAVDGNGNGYALWYQYNFNGTDYLNVTVLASTLPVASSNWSTPTILSSGGSFNPGNLRNTIKVDSSGNALAVWTTSFDNSTFNIESATLAAGGTWASTTDFINANFYAFQIDAALNSVDNIVSVFMFDNGTTSSIRANETALTGPFANIWSSPTTISTGANNGFPRVVTSYNANQVNAAAIWLSSISGTITVQAATGSKMIVAPPTNLSVAQTVNNLGVFQDYINTLTWTASTSPNLFGYAVYRNGIHYTDIPPNVPLQFVEHNQIQNGSVTYGVIAVDNFGTESLLVTITLFPQTK